VRVRFTPQADKQYLEALRYIRAKNPAGAVTVMERAEAVIAQLRAHPYSGHTIPEYPDLPHRELPVPPYRFFHRVVDDTVWITVVWHARQLPEEPEISPRVRSLRGAFKGSTATEEEYRRYLEEKAS